MKVLITGGAGYIGSTVASACIDAQITPVIIDNLSTGRWEFTKGRAFYEGDIADGMLIDRIFTDHPGISAVVHCAAKSVVQDSVADPISYYRANITSSVEFIAHLLRNKCRRMIFSSTAAVYRPSSILAVDESYQLGPQNPYARTKMLCEEIFTDIAAVQPIRVLSLRYFNVIGADPKLRTGLSEQHPAHALSQLIRAHENGTPFPIMGTNYPTRDGTATRDYLHVWDLATAHVAALNKFDTFMTKDNGSRVFNLGTGIGTTVHELVKAFGGVVGQPIKTTEAARRPGDIAGAYARIDRAQRYLGWQPEYSLLDGIRHGLDWATTGETSAK